MFLGGIERDVGKAQGLVEVARLFRVDRDTDRGTDLHLDTADRHRQADCVDELAARPERFVGNAALGDDGELVASETHYQVVRKHLLHTAGDLDQKVVAAMVTEKVVDLLEAVEVDREDDVARLRLASRGDVGHELVKQPAVGEARQDVVLGDPGGIGLGFVPPGDLSAKVVHAAEGVDEAHDASGNDREEDLVDFVLLVLRGEVEEKIHGVVPDADQVEEKANGDQNNSVAGGPVGKDA